MSTEKIDTQKKRVRKTTIYEEQDKGPSKKMLVIGSALLGIIPIAFILYIVLGPAISILSKDISAKKMKIIAGELNLRSDKSANSYVFGKFPFGTDVLVYEMDEKWAEVTVGDQKGFMSANYIREPKVFYIIDGLFGDDAMKWKLSRTQYRLALADFIAANGYMTNIPEELQEEYFEEPQERQVVQVFSEPKGMAYNSTAYGDFDGDNLKDAAFVLKNVENETNILVMFSFDKGDPMNKRKVIYTQEFDNSYFYIKKVRKGTWMYMDNQDEIENEVKKRRKKTRVLIDAIVIGTNRNKSFGDPATLLVYNGTEFDKYLQ